jgi:hypothetical protein
MHVCAQDRHHALLADTLSQGPHHVLLVDAINRSCLLAVLQFLKRTIQDGAHDSTQDARAAMDLALLKIKKGMCAWSPDLIVSCTVLCCAVPLRCAVPC